MFTPFYTEWLSTITPFLVSLYKLYCSFTPHDTRAGTSVDVERVFSQGRLLLPYIRNRLSSESTRALLCLGNWSLRGYVKDNDIKAAALLPDVNGEEPPLASGWDDIV
jgi:hypothetical protein